MVRAKDLKTVGEAGVADYSRPQTFHPTCDQCRTNIRGRHRIIRVWDQVGGGMTAMFFCRWQCLLEWAQRKVDDGYT